MAEVARQAGWTPIPFFPTRQETLEDPPPIPWESVVAVVILSPAGALAVGDRLPSGIPVLVTGPGTAAPLTDLGLDLHLASSPHGEALWELLQARCPSGGSVVCVRAERGRDFLAGACAGTAWDLYSWITHREVAVDPLPDLPEARAVLALGPLQAEVLGPRSGSCLRLAWGERTAAAFAACGYPAHDFCEPTPAALAEMLARTSPGG